jgi:hypothetical protein
MRNIFFCSLVIIATLSGCRESYDPNIESTEQKYLVVEANLNAGTGSTIIRLTRSFKLDNTARLTTENNALVTVEGEDNTIRPLINRGNGFYISPNLGLTIGTQYRLRVKTGGKEYISDYVRARQTPPIDSISWEVNNEGATIYANTHDPAKASKYYRWDFDETWEIRSQFYSMYVYVPPPADSVRERVMPQEEIFYCWKYDTSSSILLANSTRLQDDIIYKAPLEFIPRGDERMSVRYSIQVRQYALDKDAYNFYELMKKNTEEIGSLFSPQPFELKGNIHSLTDPQEYVLGYVTASTVDEKRIFINYNWRYSQNCFDLKVSRFLRDSVRIYFNNGGYIPYDYDMFNEVYKYSQAECVDCRLRGGNLQRPSFW